MASIVIVDQVTKIPALWGADVDNAVYNYLTSVAGTNTITANGPVGLAAYAAGLKFRFIPAATNTGATTINITGTGALGARNIFSGGVALVGGELTIGVPAEITDDGTRFHLSGPAIGRTIARRKTADESVSSGDTGTTLQDDNHLTFPMAANEEWKVTYHLDVGAALATTGIKIAITTPALAIQNFIVLCGSRASGTDTLRTTVSGTALDFIIAGFSNNDALMVCSAWILNGSNAGSATLQFAQSTSSATVLTSRKGSNLDAIRLA